MTPWSTEYARLLSEAQWVEEIDTRFFAAIDREIQSWPFREPLEAYVDFRGEHAFLHRFASRRQK